MSTRRQGGFVEFELRRTHTAHNTEFKPTQQVDKASGEFGRDSAHQNTAADKFQLSTFRHTSCPIGKPPGCRVAAGGLVRPEHLGGAQPPRKSALPRGSPAGSCRWTPVTPAPRAVESPNLLNARGLGVGARIDS